MGLALALVGLAAGLIACESTVVRAGEGDGGGGSGGMVTTTTTANGGAGGGSTTTSSTTWTEPDECAPFADEQGSSTVTVRFRNETGLPLYLPAGCSSVQYTIEPLGGDPSVSYVYEGSCLQTCEQLWTSPPYVCGACAPTAFLVEPGASRDVIWTGTGLTYTDAMPSECYAYPDSGGCSRVVAAPSGQYRIDAYGYSGCGGDCTCDSSGVCFGYVDGLQAYPDPVTLSFPGESLVEVVFGSCAFGCPDSSN